MNELKFNLNIFAGTIIKNYHAVLVAVLDNKFGEEQSRVSNIKSQNILRPYDVELIFDYALATQ